VLDPLTVTTYLFTDIEGSTRLWESHSEKMRRALARHDAIVRACVEGRRGTVVKMTGDGVLGAFADPLDAMLATLDLLKSLSDDQASDSVVLHVRCGMHAGVDERRDNDFFGSAVNRAARIMNVANGGQVLVSQVVAELVRERLPPGVALLDLGSVRIRDLASPEHIYQVSHPQLRRDFPALRALEATPNNLPQQTTSFLGRENALVEVRQLLQDTRLLTLVGAGGLGKTRLSLQVAAEVIGHYPDGVWFIDLAPVADAQLVPQATASVLGVKVEAGSPVIEALIHYVRDRTLLLILDNCEHLLIACAELATQLLQAGPRVAILASSREHLHVRGETTYAVLPLSLPNPNTKMTLEALVEGEAVRLFAVRASAAQPGFLITESNAKAVAAICEQLDGIPLALELAAARVRALSVEQVAVRLSDRFALLTRGDHTALPRQQTLRASIDWSYDILSTSERALLRRLTVFAGGWTLEAAEAVGVGNDVTKPEVLDLLTNLVEKSLVVRSAQGDRYKLLESVHQYGKERLQQSHELETTIAHHVAFYLSISEDARSQMLIPSQGFSNVLARLDLERENFLAAHAYCDRIERGAELGLRLVFALNLYLIYQGLLSLGHRLTLEALARDQSASRDVARCCALHSVGQLSFYMGRFIEAQRYLEEGLSIGRETGEIDRVAACLVLLGTLALQQGNLGAARIHSKMALEVAREAGNARRLADALNGLAELERTHGNLEAAVPLYEESLAIDRTIGDRFGTANALCNLARVFISSGSSGRARTMLLEAFSIEAQIGAKHIGPLLLEICAGLAASYEEHVRSARFFGAAEEQLRALGSHREQADIAFLTPLLALTRKGLNSGAFAAAEAEGRALSYDDAVAAARTWVEELSR
jgi:predicted ATPase/class 3 adenylate cyclase